MLLKTVMLRAPAKYHGAINRNAQIENSDGCPPSQTGNQYSE